MVSFWPWRGDSSSTASFEKTLSTLSTKIAAQQARLDKLRSNSRRVKVLWTLYITFAYLVYAIVLVLVVGYKNMGAYEWTGMAGGPVLIYAARKLIATYFNFRIESLSTRLKDNQTERAKTIQKLKDATKYDSTLELIEKYGGVDGKPKPNKTDAEGEGPKDGQRKHGDARPPQRTSFQPPPTANIPRRDGLSAPGTPAMQGGPFAPPTPVDVQPEALYAPNAEYDEPDSPVAPAPRPQRSGGFGPSHNAAPSSGGGGESHWYDRIFDVLLGEDETASKNRVVLICRACRQVNGQAPPGTRSLGELGMWKCFSCGASNGEMDEGKRIVKEVLEAEDKPSDEDDVETQIQQEDAAVRGRDEDGPASSVRKRKAKGKK